MIIVDENIHARSIIENISNWYSGQVISVTILRPGTIIKDNAIPMLLLQSTQPTFVTINVTDFWRKVPAHQGYCIVGLILPTERVYEVPQLLRSVLQSPRFKTKISRMGSIIRFTPPHRLEFYETDGFVQKIDFKTGLSLF
jgi:hypothetical protein